MALSGDLKDFGLLQLLTLVQVTNKTGALALQRPGEAATLYFESGRLTKVRPPMAQPEGLATLLHKAGLIDRETYEEIEAQAPPSEQALGLLLADQGKLSQEQLVEFIRERSLADLYSLLTWPEGSFRFDVGVAPPEEEILAPTDLGPVLEKGRSYLDEWQMLVSSIPSLDRPLRLLPEPRQATEEIRLSLSEWRMVSTLCGDTPLKEVASRLGLDEFEVRKLAYRLISAGLADVPELEFIPPPAKEFRELREEDESKPGPLARLFGRK
ncbi:MAG: DUF4388 domain-containing protein [Sphingomonadaceae bacterium]